MRSCVLVMIAACGSNPPATTDAPVGHGDSPSGADAAPLTPDALPGMLLWLDGASGVTGTGWTDRSGSGHDTSCVGGMLTTGTINSHPSAHLDGSLYCQLAANVPSFAVDDGVLVAVAAAFTASGGGLIAIEGGTSSTNVRLSAGNNALGEIGTVDVTASGNFSDGQPHVFVVARQSNVVSLRIDGVEAMHVGVNVPTVTGGLHLYVGAAHPIVDIGEELVYRAAISADQIAGLESYLAAKYRP